MSNEPFSSGTRDAWADVEPSGSKIDRFTLRGVLGRGGWGVVYRASDPLTPGEIALKVIPARSAPLRDRVAREVLALGVVQDPGVVRMIGHGDAPEGLWIAMELVDGQPFPPGPWSRLAPTVLALLETVARVHSLGIVHRDLKPGNVLVRPDGRPVVLDFGLARGDLIGDTLTREGAVLGTPRYLAPEQIEGRRAGDRADVYALGVMLYEALTGRPPHPQEDLLGLRAARAFQSPTPLERLVPDVPAPVAGLIRRMLARSPEDRPTASDLVRTLTGRALPSALDLPRLDGLTLVETLVGRLRQGDSVDVWGPRESGRSRLLDDIACALPMSWRTSPEDRPFASLLNAIGPLPDAAPDVVQQSVRERLASLSGPLLVDDWHLVDPWTRALLLELALPFGQLRVRDAPDAVALSPLSEDALALLFEGPERVLHLPTDAASMLIRHTGGWPGRVANLLQRWVRQGRILRVGSNFIVERDILDTLIEETVEPPPPERFERDLSPEQEDVLTAARIAWPQADEALLSQILGRPQWEVALQVDLLVGRGAIAREGERLNARSEPTGRWTAERKRAAQGIVVERMSPGTPGRLAHCLASGVVGALVEEIWASASRLINRGQTRRAIALLWRLRELDPRDDKVALLLLRLLLEQRTANGLTQARFAVSAAHVQALLLVEATRMARSDTAAQVEALLAPVIWEDPELAMLSFAARFEASRALPLEEQQELVDRLSAEPVVRSSRERHARWENWLGILRFRQGDYRESAAVHEAAAPHRGSEAERLTSLINAVRAWIEADDLDRAARLAEEVREAAERARLANLEAQASLMLRAVANRHFETRPDPELPEAIARLGDAMLSAQAFMIEGYIARRGGLEVGAALAERARLSFEHAGMGMGVLHARALAWSWAPNPVADELVQGLLASPDPRLTLDGLGLVATAGSVLRLPAVRWEALIHAQAGVESPYPYGAFSRRQALLAIQPLLELS